jgi:hypothetical protein
MQARMVLVMTGGQHQPQEYIITGDQLDVLYNYCKDKPDVPDIDATVRSRKYNRSRSISKQETAWRTIRPEVRDFAFRMEEKLRENDHKSHWSKESYAYLLQGLKDEVDELEQELSGFIIGQAMPRDLSGSSSIHQYGEAVEESVDVANFAMMIKDNLIHLRDNDKDYRYFTDRIINTYRGKTR